MKQLASAMDLADDKAFVTALDERFAWEFAGRHLDLQGLVAY